MLANFKKPVPEDDNDLRIMADVTRFGCEVMAIGADDKTGSPDFVYSIGYYVNYEQPEVLIVGISSEAGGRILNDLNERLRGGLQLHDGMIISAIYNGRDLRFRKIEEIMVPDYLGYACWYYRKTNPLFPALQALWPDKTGKFPGDLDCDPRAVKFQELHERPE